jgi:hypothetical protein
VFLEIAAHTDDWHHWLVVQPSHPPFLETVVAVHDPHYLRAVLSFPPPFLEIVVAVHVPHYWRDVLSSHPPFLEVGVAFLDPHYWYVVQRLLLTFRGSYAFVGVLPLQLVWRLCLRPQEFDADFSVRTGLRHSFRMCQYKNRVTRTFSRISLRSFE